MERVEDNNQNLKTPKRRRFNDAGDASQEIYDGFNRWSSMLTKHSIEATFAIIAANWAVHGSTKMLLENINAKWSLIIAIAFLGINLLGTSLMTCCYGRRCTYADKDKNRWELEFRAATSKQSPWPYTCCIEWLGTFLRFFRTFAPTVSAWFFIKSLL